MTTQQDPNAAWDETFVQEDEAAVPEEGVVTEVEVEPPFNPAPVTPEMVGAPVAETAVPDNIDQEDIRLEFDDPENVRAAIAVDDRHRVVSESELREAAALVTLPSDINENVLAALATLTGGTDFSRGLLQFNKVRGDGLQTLNQTRIWFSR